MSSKFIAVHFCFIMHYHQNFEKIALNTYKNKVDLFVKSIAKIDKVCYHNKEYELQCRVVSVAGILRTKDIKK